MFKHILRIVMSVSVRVDVGGSAAGVGGLMWMVKGIVILSGGAQPLFLFEGAPLFFGVGLIGMYSTFGADPGRLAKFGVILAYLALPLAIGNVLKQFNNADLFFPADFAVLGSLLLLGLALVRSNLNQYRWKRWPLALGLAFVPSLVVGAVLESFDERFLEIPLVFLGLVWLILGYLILKEQIRP